MDKFFRKRLNLIFDEAEEELKNDKDKTKAKLTPTPPGSILQTFKDNGIYIHGENKYIYERDNGKIRITDMTTGKVLTKQDYTKKNTCTYMGFKNETECAGFIDQCILGDNISQCTAFLQKKDFWITDIEEFRYSANFYAVYNSLKKYEMKTETKSDGMIVLEKFETWLDRTIAKIGKIPPEITELLRLSVEEINKHPAILNYNYSIKSTSAATDDDDENVELILSKLHEDTRKTLPKIQSKGPTSGTVYMSDVITEQTHKLITELNGVMKGSLSSIQEDIKMLKIGLDNSSITTKYFQHQRGGGGDGDIKSMQHYLSMNELKEQLLDKDQRITNFLLQEFNNNIKELNNKGTEIAPENVDQIKEELMKVKRVEILHKTILYYIRKFFFFFYSDFTPFLVKLEKHINPAYEHVVQKMELTLGELFKLVDSTYEKFDNYCKKDGKIQSLARICDQLADLASPPIKDEYTDAFRPLMNPFIKSLR
jgi:hypothetical protein